MRGQRTKWILGTDHAGIATQKQVEKLLAGEGRHREDLGREAFVQRIWAWREQYGGTIIEQLKRLGATADFEDERFTLDERYVRAVLKVFVDLHSKGYIYRDHYLVNWDPGSRSAISDLEVEDREVVGHALLDRVPAGRRAAATRRSVATVRPETMLADVAVAVNPDDDRYRGLVGRTAMLPLVGRALPIIADDYVKTDFGTGALKITPGHDPNDFEIGRRHGLAELSVVGEDGRMTEAAGDYAGLTGVEARERVVAELDAQGLLRAREPYTHTVPVLAPLGRSGSSRSSRCSGSCAWTSSPPGRRRRRATAACGSTRSPSARRYLAWLDDIRPWCLSRQLWWGHQLPVWYRGDETYVGEEPPEGEGWERDPDVLDTWFSSALWPFATLGWPDDTPELRAFYPTDVLSTRATSSSCGSPAW